LHAESRQSAEIVGLNAQYAERAYADGREGCGEVGTIGSPAAVTNAVVDALSHYGISHIDMPMTPNSIWCLIRKGALPQAAE